MWKSEYVGVYQLLNWKMHGETLKLRFNLWDPSQNCRRQLLAVSCPSVHMEQLGSHWTNFHEIRYFIVFRKSVEKIQVWLKSGDCLSLMCHYYECSRILWNVCTFQTGFTASHRSSLSSQPRQTSSPTKVTAGCHCVVSLVYQSKLTLLTYIQDVSCSNLGRDTDYRDRFYFPCFPQSPQAVMSQMLACWLVCSLMRLVWAGVGAVTCQDRLSVGDVPFTTYGREHDGTLYCCVLWVFCCS